MRAIAPNYMMYVGRHDVILIEASARRSSAGIRTRVFASCSIKGRTSRAF